MEHRQNADNGPIKGAPENVTQRKCTVRDKNKTRIEDIIDKNPAWECKMVTCGEHRLKIRQY